LLGSLDPTIQFDDGVSLPHLLHEMKKKVISYYKINENRACNIYVVN